MRCSTGWDRATCSVVGDVQLFQGTPLLMQLFLTCFGLALLGIDTSAWTAVAVAVALCTSAFLVEIWRGCMATPPPCALRQRVGMIFPSFNLFPHLSVGRNVVLAPGRVKKTDLATGEAQARQLLERVGLADKFGAFPDQLSGGQRLRMVDSLALDGRALLMVSHEMAFARKVSDRVIFMHQGRVHEVGPPAQLFGQPQTPALQQFLSSIHRPSASSPTPPPAKPA